MIERSIVTTPHLEEITLQILQLDTTSAFTESAVASATRVNRSCCSKTARHLVVVCDMENKDDVSVYMGVTIDLRLRGDEGSRTMGRGVVNCDAVLSRGVPHGECAADSDAAVRTDMGQEPPSEQLRQIWAVGR